MASTRGMRLHADDPILIPGVAQFRISNGHVDDSILPGDLPRPPKRAKPEAWATIVATRRAEAKRARRKRCRQASK